MKIWLLAGLALVGLNQASEAQPAGDTVARGDTVSFIAFADLLQ